MSVSVKSLGKFERFEITAHKDERERMWEIVDEMEIRIITMGPLRLAIDKCDLNIYHIVGEKELK